MKNNNKDRLLIELPEWLEWAMGNHNCAERTTPKPKQHY